MFKHTRGKEPRKLKLDMRTQYLVNVYFFLFPFWSLKDSGSSGPDKTQKASFPQLWTTNTNKRLVAHTCNPSYLGG
jgi:hypothetical protein